MHKYRVCSISNATKFIKNDLLNIFVQLPKNLQNSTLLRQYISGGGVSRPGRPSPGWPLERAFILLSGETKKKVWGARSGL